MEGPSDDPDHEASAFWYTHDGGCSSIVGATFLEPGTFGRNGDTLVAGDFGFTAVWFASIRGGRVATVEHVATLEGDSHGLRHVA